VLGLGLVNAQCYIIYVTLLIYHSLIINALSVIIQYLVYSNFIETSINISIHRLYSTRHV